MTAACWIDLMRPVTPAQIAGWRFYLSLHREQWRAARAAFRRVHTGMPPGEATLGFVADTGVTDPAVLAELEAALRDLAAERGP